MSSLIQDSARAGASVGLKGDRMTINGGRPLSGRIELKGAKNLVTKAMVAALLGETPSVLRDVPAISDVGVVRGLLEVHGVKVSDGDAEGVLHLDPSNVESANFVDIDAHAGSSRIPILFCGPLLHRLGEAFIPDLGGCRIGDRPIDYHLEVLRNFGAVVEKLPSGIRMSAPNGLHGAKVALPYPSVGATEQVLLTAVRADGITELRGAAIEPEIMDLINILQKMGAIISVDTDRVIRIEGVDALSGYDHRALFDRNEAASWAAAALATNGDIFVGGARQPEMLTFLNVYRKVGGGFEIHDDGIRFFHPGGELNPVIIETDVHPGFMTDWQQPLVVALTKATGVSIVHETVYEQRFGFVDALVEMGATIQVHKECLGGQACRFGQRNFKHSAVISGPSRLHGADIVVPDLRGGFSHLIAALSAEGVSHVSNVGIISRGYENFINKLEQLGADFVLEA
ncbi:UDP-N-acetylglucosamine 1-carboxyvinyltransferase [Mycetocola reblochoni]|uniref:UDP-N-acetylglucosamine 1-carboxyvinyltransferase n=3 Tax=Mycetocola reblochoni TaxID=331618 RepID=A0A1R4JBX6_9MICO|nr:UDP-N-acetylglucosamine 1-carboxyvinyltransferase [Mycetocola reblochoni]RLP70022.1 UDP-N-acetylglucosamine 1-carboxyvinyltransferase [Mycetocola reblochoni]SJN29213.1 UDP-N-acetylglucosamine 1-carboxyvinyltransferase [Mycetocola reblochoni REB411]